MRLRISSNFRIFNENDGEFLVVIREIHRSIIIVEVGELLRSAIKERDLVLAICIIKPDNMQIAINSAIQLGVTRIVPIISERTQNKKIKRDKLLKSIIQATEQSERFTVAELLPETSLEDFCKMDEFEQVIFACETENKENQIKDITKLSNSIAVLIGAEGGFSEEEVSMLKSFSHIAPISLGKNVLRAETAVIATLACVNMMRD